MTLEGWMIRASLQFTLPALISVLLLCLCATATDYQGSFERKFPVNGPARLEIDTGSWDVTVHRGSAGAVIVTGRIHVNDRWLFGDRSARVRELENTPPVRQDGNTIQVGHTNLNNIYVDYEITVPADTRVQSRTGSADIKIQELNSDIDLQSGSGDLILESITGRIQARSGSGDVRAKDISGAFSAQASSGDIQLDERGKGDVDIHTTSGNIGVTGIEGALRVEAGSGDISAEGTPAGNWEARTGSGNVHLSLPRNSAFQLEASTSSGELNVNHAITLTVQGNLDTARHELKGTVGSGGPQLTVHTGSGDIVIE
jgi:putative adhesin